LRIAVLGASAFAEAAHIPGLNAHPRVSVVALYSRDPRRAREMAERCGIAASTDDLDALLARGDIDAVTIASANDRHHPYALAALRAGKHVFCEKPMALNAAQSAEMAAAAARSGVVHQMAFIFRYTYCMRELRRLVTGGDIGAPHYVSVQGERFAPPAAAAQSATWRDDASVHGAGQLGEMGSHFIDTVNFVCGPACGFITEVAGVVQTMARDVLDATGSSRRVDTLDIASFLLRTEGGLQGHVMTSRATAPPQATMHARGGQPGHMGYIVVSGDKGALMASFSRGDGEALWRMAPGGQWEPVALPPEAGDGTPHAVRMMMSSFVDSVLRGAVAPDIDATFDDGHRSQSAIDAVMASSGTRRWEPVAT
jgi:predicted dehydrogenase